MILDPNSPFGIFTTRSVADLLVRAEDGGEAPDFVRDRRERCCFQAGLLMIRVATGGLMQDWGLTPTRGRGAVFHPLKTPQIAVIPPRIATGPIAPLSALTTYRTSFARGRIDLRAIASLSCANAQKGVLDRRAEGDASHTGPEMRGASLRRQHRRIQLAPL